MDKATTSSMLVTAVALRNRLEAIKLSDGRLAEAVLQLAEFKLLSAGQIGSILEISDYKVSKFLKQFMHLDYLTDKRGSLNPLHLEALAYLVSLWDGDSTAIDADMLNRIINEGTSLSTVADLTGISQATLYRLKED